MLFQLIATKIPANRLSRDTLDYSRCAWLEIKEATYHSQGNRTVKFYIPQEVFRCIPSYKSQLDQQKAALKGDTEPTIRDQTSRDPEVVSKAIRFLASGYLFPLDAKSSTCKVTLEGFVKLSVQHCALHQAPGNSGPQPHRNL
jgi:hypothetical protein